MSAITQPAQSEVRTVPCPRCLSDAGVWCMGTRKPRKANHLERVKAYLDSLGVRVEVAGRTPRRGRMVRRARAQIDAPAALFTRPGPAFEARYAGMCWSCGERWSRGGSVCYVGKGVLTHAGHCADVAIALGR